MATDSLDAADSSDSEIFLYFQPAIDGIGGSIEQALGEATAYHPELMVDGEVRQGSAFPVLGATDIFSGGAPIGSPDESALARPGRWQHHARPAAADER